MAEGLEKSLSEVLLPASSPSSSLVSRPLIGPLCAGGGGVARKAGSPRTSPLRLRVFFLAFLCGALCLASQDAPGESPSPGGVLESKASAASSSFQGEVGPSAAPASRHDAAGGGALRDSRGEGLFSSSEAAFALQETASPPLGEEAKSGRASSASGLPSDRRRAGAAAEVRLGEPDTSSVCQAPSQGLARDAAANSKAAETVCATRQVLSYSETEAAGGDGGGDSLAERRPRRALAFLEKFFGLRVSKKEQILSGHTAAAPGLASAESAHLAAFSEGMKFGRQRRLWRNRFPPRASIHRPSTRLSSPLAASSRNNPARNHSTCTRGTPLSLSATSSLPSSPEPETAASSRWSLRSEECLENKLKRPQEETSNSAPPSPAAGDAAAVYVLLDEFVRPWLEAVEDALILCLGKDRPRGESPAAASRGELPETTRVSTSPCVCQAVFESKKLLPDWRLRRRLEVWGLLSSEFSATSLSLPGSCWPSHGGVFEDSRRRALRAVFGDTCLRETPLQECSCGGELLGQSGESAVEDSQWALAKPGVLSEKSDAASFFANALQRLRRLVQRGPLSNEEKREAVALQGAQATSCSHLAFPPNCLLEGESYAAWQEPCVLCAAARCLREELRRIDAALSLRAEVLVQTPLVSGQSSSAPRLAASPEGPLASSPPPLKTQQRLRRARSTRSASRRRWLSVLLQPSASPTTWPVSERRERQVESGQTPAEAAVARGRSEEGLRGNCLRDPWPFSPATLVGERQTCFASSPEAKSVLASKPILPLGPSDEPAPEDAFPREQLPSETNAAPSAPPAAGVGGSFEEPLLYGRPFLRGGELSPSFRRLRFDFASLDAGARIVASTPEMQHVKALQRADGDSYLLVPCEVKGKHFVLSFSESLKIDSVAIQALEIYASAFRHIQLLGSHSFPTSAWRLVANIQTAPDAASELFSVAEECERLDSCWVRQRNDASSFGNCELNGAGAAAAIECEAQVFGATGVQMLETHAEDFAAGDDSHAPSEEREKFPPNGDRGAEASTKAVDETEKKPVTARNASPPSPDTRTSRAASQEAPTSAQKLAGAAAGDPGSPHAEEGAAAEDAVFDSSRSGEGQNASGERRNQNASAGRPRGGASGEEEVFLTSGSQQQQSVSSVAAGRTRASEESALREEEKGSFLESVGPQSLRGSLQGEKSPTFPASPVFNSLPSQGLGDEEAAAFDALSEALQKTVLQNEAQNIRSSQRPLQKRFSIASEAPSSEASSASSSKFLPTATEAALRRPFLQSASATGCEARASSVAGNWRSFFGGTTPASVWENPCAEAEAEAEAVFGRGQVLGGVSLFPSGENSLQQQRGEAEAEGRPPGRDLALRFGFGQKEGRGQERTPDTLRQAAVYARRFLLHALQQQERQSSQKQPISLAFARHLTSGAVSAGAPAASQTERLQTLQRLLMKEGADGDPFFGGTEAERGSVAGAEIPPTPTPASPAKEAKGSHVLVSLAERLRTLEGETAAMKALLESVGHASEALQRQMLQLTLLLQMQQQLGSFLFERLAAFDVLLPHVEALADVMEAAGSAASPSEAASTRATNTTGCAKEEAADFSPQASSSLPLHSSIDTAAAQRGRRHRRRCGSSSLPPPFASPSPFPSGPFFFFKEWLGRSLLWASRALTALLAPLAHLLDWTARLGGFLLKAQESYFCAAASDGGGAVGWVLCFFARGVSWTAAETFSSAGAAGAAAVEGVSLVASFLFAATARLAATLLGADGGGGVRPGGVGWVKKALSSLQSVRGAAGPDGGLAGEEGEAASSATDLLFCLAAVALAASFVGLFFWKLRRSQRTAAAAVGECALLRRSFAQLESSIASVKRDLLLQRREQQLLLLLHTARRGKHERRLTSAEEDAPQQQAGKKATPTPGYGQAAGTQQPHRSNTPQEGAAEQQAEDCLRGGIDGRAGGPSDEGFLLPDLRRSSDGHGAESLTPPQALRELPRRFGGSAEGLRHAGLAAGRGGVSCEDLLLSARGRESTAPEEGSDVFAGEAAAETAERATSEQRPSLLRRLSSSLSPRALLGFAASPPRKEAAEAPPQVFLARPSCVETGGGVVEEKAKAQDGSPHEAEAPPSQPPSPAAAFPLQQPHHHHHHHHYHHAPQQQPHPQHGGQHQQQQQRLSAVAAVARKGLRLQRHTVRPSRKSSMAAPVAEASLGGTNFASALPGVVAGVLGGGAEAVAGGGGGFWALPASSSDDFSRETSSLPEAAPAELGVSSLWGGEGSCSGSSSHNNNNNNNNNNNGKSAARNESRQTLAGPLEGPPASGPLRSLHQMAWNYVKRNAGGMDRAAATKASSSFDARRTPPLLWRRGQASGSASSQNSSSSSAKNPAADLPAQNATGASQHALRGPSVASLQAVLSASRSLISPFAGRREGRGARSSSSQAKAPPIPDEARQRSAVALRQFAQESQPASRALLPEDSAAPAPLSTSDSERLHSRGSSHEAERVWAAQDSSVNRDKTRKAPTGGGAFVAAGGEAGKREGRRRRKRRHGV